LCNCEETRSDTKRARLSGILSYTQDRPLSLLWAVFFCPVAIRCSGGEEEMRDRAAPMPGHRLWITHAGNVTSSMKHLVTPVIIVAITYVVIFLGLMFALWVTGGS
jgi:hypothetical protein